jgi:hypothetical protein
VVRFDFKCFKVLVTAREFAETGHGTAPTQAGHEPEFEFCRMMRDYRNRVTERFRIDGAKCATGRATGTLFHIVGENVTRVEMKSIP